MGLTRYPSYKPSGIEWIGEIPSHWEGIRLKYVGSLYSGLTGKSAVDFNKKGNSKNRSFIPFKNIANNFKIDPNNLESVVIEDNDDQNIVRKGDLLFMMSSENFDDVGKSTILLDDLGDAYLNSFCRGYRIKPEIANASFLNYLLNGDIYRKRLLIEANGFTRINLKVDKVSGFLAYLPPLPEQTAIAAYLDGKTAQIDSLIAAKRRMIELLNEERMAIINEAVNGEGKGWERKKLKYVVSKVGSGVTPRGGANTYLMAGIPFLRSQNILNEGLDLSDIVFIDEEVDNEMSNSRIQDGDVLLNITGASIGRCCFVPNGFGRGNVNQHVCILRPLTQIIKSEYLQKFMISNFGQTMVGSYQNGSNREGLNYQQLKSFVVDLPSRKEQEDTLQQLSLKTSELDKVIDTSTLEIDLLVEYRTSLINEVVTGKLKVA